MNGLYLVIASALILVIAYRLYGSFVAAKVLTVNQYRTTPAVAINDGVDYVPTNKWVTFGQHFAAIAGAGPLVGPVIAAQFGYLPGVLWILIGSVLAGAVHDFVLLFASVRYNGKSIADIAKSEISSVAGMGTLLATLFLLIITMAGMAAVVANSLENSPWGFFTVSATIPIAVFIGIYLRWIRPGKIREATVIGVALIMAAVVYGPDIAHSSLAPYFTWDRKSIQIMLAVYSFFAAALPVWLLLAPRGYLSTYMKVGTIGALALGIILVMPVLQMPAFSDYVNGGGPVLSGSAVPFVFITIACGALSGFHATVSTGTTPKMITNEKEMLPIGYGAMLTEAFIAMMALIAATSLHPNDYFAINSTTETFSALGLQVQELPMLSQMVGEDLMHRPGGAVSLAVGMAHIFSKIPNMSHLMSYWYHFCIMFEALFILTLIDTGTRVSRYMVQELLGMAWPKMKDAHWLPGVYIASFLVCFTWGYLVLQGNIGTIWPLFGVSNQLLATMGLAIGTTVIMHLGHKRYAWVTMIPCFFIAIITVMADYQNVFGNYIPEGQWMLVGVSVVMFILVAVVMVEAVRSWIRLVKQPQDFRTEADIEEETLEDMEPENV
ncbi:carbon starvation protein A [Veillonella ratti]|nr:carbon starvation protein A [Veillonella ratti]MCB5756484.1 carbon starvation protein A [Veillonella ratti]MCB5758788.1 carbon starvation protein A [Veillonella ratti]MCB5761084.1 carbon starvation protein A [Veillonella ratti]MCB5781461.1 carbon starvation protein A [Veillonella ratti]